jgi:hypothetical protein
MRFSPRMSESRIHRLRAESDQIIAAMHDTMDLGQDAALAFHTVIADLVAIQRQLQALARQRRDIARRSLRACQQHLENAARMRLQCTDTPSWPG